MHKFMVERLAVMEGWKPSSIVVCEIVNSVDQENFTFVWEKSGNFINLCLWQLCHQGTVGYSVLVFLVRVMMRPI